MGCVSGQAAIQRAQAKVHAAACNSEGNCCHALSLPMRLFLNANESRQKVKVEIRRQWRFLIRRGELKRSLAGRCGWRPKGDTWLCQSSSLHLSPLFSPSYLTHMLCYPTSLIILPTWFHQALKLNVQLFPLCVVFHSSFFGEGELKKRATKWTPSKCRYVSYGGLNNKWALSWIRLPPPLLIQRVHVVFSYSTLLTDPRGFLLNYSPLSLPAP